MTEQKEKKDYELAFLAKGESDAAEVSSFLRSASAEVFFESPRTSITLAYRIKKEQSALFGYACFSLDPGKLKSVETELRLKSGILRFLLITPPFGKSKPAVFSADRARAPRTSREGDRPQTLSNEALEKKIEEILQ